MLNGRKIFLMAGLLDAGVVSLSGFLINILGGRLLPEAAFGIFVTLIALSTIPLTIQAAIVSGPYSVLSQRLDRDSSPKDHLLGALLLTLLLAGGTAFLSTWIAYALVSEHMRALTQSPWWLGFAAFLFGIVVQDFVRRALFVSKREAYAFALDTLSYSGQIASIWIFRAGLDLGACFAWMAGASFTASFLVSVLALRGVIWRELSIRRALQAIPQHWSLGRWMLATNGISWVANQLYMVAVAAFQSPLSMAQLNASRTIAASSNPLMMALDSMGLPRAARVYNESGGAALRRFLLRIGLVGTALFGTLGVVVLVFPLETIRLIFGKSFGDISTLVRLFACMPLLWFLSRTFTIGLHAMKKPQSQLPVQLFIAMLTLTAGLQMAKEWGALGAGIGLLFNSVALAVGYGFQFLRYSSPPKPISEQGATTRVTP